MSLTKVSFSMITGAWSSPLDFGAVGNGIADDTAALQALATASKYINLGGSAYSYKVSGTITLQSGTTIIGGFATITQTANLTSIFNIVGRTDIAITEVNFVGVGTDYAESDANPSATAVYSNSGEARIQIIGNKFTNFSYASVRFKAATDIQFCNNIVVGVDTPTITAGVSGRSYGFLADTGCDRVLVSGNTVSKGGQGLRIESTSNARVSDNYIYNIIGQHGMYFGSNIQNLAVTGNNVKSTSLIGIKVQAQNTTVNSNNIAITGNTITSTGDQGINFTNAAGSTLQPVQNFNVTITGNTFSDITATAINVQNTNIATIGNNSIYQANGSGINLSACTFVDVSNNLVNDIEYSGIRDEAPCTNVNITENILNNCATGAHAGDAYGIFIQSGTTLEISGNTITDGAANMIYGIYVAGGSQPSQSIFNNQVFNSTAQAIRFASATDEIAMYANNLLVGTTGASVNNPDIPDVTAAATITLSTALNVFRINGATGITSINTAGHSGHQVTLIFTSTPTVTDGSNLKLAGNFVATADDTLTLACDGSNWYEVARSAN